MFKSYKKKILVSAFLFLLAVILMFLPSHIPILDEKEDEFFKTAIKKAVVTYATVRGVNAAVSVAKETEVSATPLGFGVDIHIGEVLDPIDDAVERLSSTLTISMAGLFLVRIFSEIFQEFAFKILSILLVIMIPFIWLDNKQIVKFFVSFLFFITVLRIALPFGGILNNFLYKNYFEPRLSQNIQILQSLYKDDKNIETETSDILIRIKEKVQKIDKLLKIFKENADKIVMAVINLIILNISMLFIQIFLIPLGIVFFLYKMLSLIKV